MPIRLKAHCAPRAERGIVLVLALILLTVISLLALTSLRQAASAESIAGNTRTTELATQAAEIALRHCEASLIDVLNSSGSGTPSDPSKFGIAQVLPYSSTPQWQNKTLWDGDSTNVFVLPLLLLNQPGIATTYHRPPECMVERLSAASEPYYVITVRGFGPEVPQVPAGAARTRPVGSEIWLQSSIKVGDA